MIVWSEIAVTLAAAAGVAVLGQLSISTDDVIGLVPPVGGIVGALWAFDKLLKRWDDRDSRNIAELWKIVESHKGRTEQAEHDLTRERAAREAAERAHDETMRELARCQSALEEAS